MRFPSFVDIQSNIEHNRFASKSNAMDPRLTAMVEPLQIDRVRNVHRLMPDMTCL
jgi:hypothetical protein